MQKKQSSDRIRIRPATAADKSPILEISKTVWSGYDYLPLVWDDWLADTKGRLIVATVKGQTVGVAHATLQTPDVAWLEGVRVHEKYRGYGIAGKLNKALVDWAEKKHARVARLCTGSSNDASRKHLDKIGFPLLQTFQRVDSTRPLRAKPAGVTTARASAMRLWNWVSARPEFVENRAMYSDGWTWYPLTLQSFKKHLANGNVLVTTRNNQPTSCCILVDEDKVVTMGFVAGEKTGITKLFRMLRFLLSQKQRERVRVLLPVESSMVRTVQSSGFEKTANILVYEKFLG